jgi:hypothetical protein
VSGDFWRIGLAFCEFGSPETGIELQKPAIGGLSAGVTGYYSEHRTAWLEREGSNLDTVNWKSGALAYPREISEPIFAGTDNPFETIGF